MKKCLILLLVVVLVMIPILSSCSNTSTSTSSPSPTQSVTTSIAPSSTQPFTTTTPPVSSTSASGTTAPSTTPASSVVTGGTLILEGGGIPKDIGYQPTMAVTDKFTIFQSIAERLMNMNTQGQLVPELATSVDADPAAKTITWHLRQGVQFQDGTPFNAQAAAWNFHQLKDAGTLQFGDEITGMEVLDNYTLRFTLKQFSYAYLQSFSFNVFMLSPTAIEKNGKQWAISHVYGTGPFELKSFDPTTGVVVVKNPNYWRSGLPYLDGLELDNNQDSAVLSDAMQSNEIQFMVGGDLVLQKNLLDKGFTSVLFSPNPTVEFLVPSSNDPNSPLSNPLVREACEYAIDRGAICQGLLQGTADPMDQMAYQGAVGYDPANAWSYDIAKAQQLLAQAGYPGGKGISISIYVPIPAPLVAECTAVAGYLQQIGITANVVKLTFPAFATMGAQGWKNGFIYERENSGAIWSTAFLNWLGPLPTLNPLPSLVRSDAYNNLANQILSAPDAATENSIVTQLVKMVHDNSMVMPLWSDPTSWVSQPFVHTEEAATNNRTFDWAKVWTEKP